MVASRLLDCVLSKIIERKSKLEKILYSRRTINNTVKLAFSVDKGVGCGAIYLIIRKLFVIKIYPTLNEINCSPFCILSIIIIYISIFPLQF